MTDTTATANVVILPPIAWAIAFAAGLAADWLYPLPFLPASLPYHWIGAAIVLAAGSLAIWAERTIAAAGSAVRPTRPTTAIVTGGPFRFSRNPIYLGIFLGQGGFAVAFDTLWMLVTLVPLYLVIRHGVVAREEAYLRRTFPGVYDDYQTRVRRWL